MNVNMPPRNNEQVSYLPAVVTTAFALALTSALVVLYCGRQSKPTKDEEHWQELLPVENFAYFFEPPLSTLTWFRGDHSKANSILKARIQEILMRNPWLGGRIILHTNGKVYLLFPKSNGSVSLDENHLDHVSPNISPISRHDDPCSDQFSKATRIYRLSKKEEKECLWRISIIPCRTEPDQYFAVIMSMSHVIGDGHTFYFIHRMLFSNDDIPSLIVERIKTSPQQQAELLGEAEFYFKQSFGFIFNTMGGFLYQRCIAPRFGQRIESYYFQVDNQVMEQQKLEDAKAGKVPFVSTNDVIVSWFFRTCNCKQSLMTTKISQSTAGTFQFACWQLL